MSDSINGNLAVRAAMDSHRMAWQPSPSGTVFRKRLHRVGPPESGQVTSLVRYEPGATFPAHDHPGGEEILVLEGVFSDEHGDWPAGTYLLNPEGFRHAPFSEPGCLLFVKLRQYPGSDRLQMAVDTNSLPWSQSAVEGIASRQLYQQEAYADATWLERWSPGAGCRLNVARHGLEIYVIEGAVYERMQSHGAGTWLRLPPGTSLDLRSPEGCILYAKRGGFAYLKSA